MVLAAAGAVDHDQLVKLASSAFGSVPDEERSVQQLVAAVSSGARGGGGRRGSGVDRPLGLGAA
jgi:predicted Zn-dependent peptidase